MYTVEYVVISAALIGILVALGKAAWKSPKEDPRKSRETTRWKAFRVHFSPVHQKHPSLNDHVVEELPKGLKLFVSPREPAGRHFVLEDSKGKERIRISRGMLLARKKLQVSVNKQPLCRLRPPPKGKKVPVVDAVDALESCKIQGDPYRREYELRKAGKLAAIVSRQGPTRDSDLGQDYLVETLKTERALPLLAVVLALEIALGPTDETYRDEEDSDQKRPDPEARR